MAPVPPRARRPVWPLPAAVRVIRCCGLPPGRRRDPVPWVVDELGAQGGRRWVGDPVPKVASGGGWGVIWCAVGPGPPRARGPVWLLPAARRVNRFCRWLPARR